MKERRRRLPPEAYAVVREAAWRSIGMRHYRVQLIGGIILHQGRIAEMRTGEGKTLVSTLPAYLNALSRKKASISLRSMIIWHSEIPSGWEKSTSFWD